MFLGYRRCAALSQHLAWNCGFAQQAPEGVGNATRFLCGATFVAAGDKDVARVYFAGGEKIIGSTFLRSP